MKHFMLIMLILSFVILSSSYADESTSWFQVEDSEEVRLEFSLKMPSDWVLELSSVWISGGECVAIAEIKHDFNEVGDRYCERTVKCFSLKMPRTDDTHYYVIDKTGYLNTVDQSIKVVRHSVAIPPLAKDAIQVWQSPESITKDNKDTHAEPEKTLTRSGLMNDISEDIDDLQVRLIKLAQTNPDASADLQKQLDLAVGSLLTQQISLKSYYYTQSRVNRTLTDMEVKLCFEDKKDKNE